MATRRSTRSAAANNGSNGRSGDEWADWRGERRSARLGAPAETQLDGHPPKRARTEESTTSSLDPPVAATASGNGIKLKVNGAAAVKPTETLVETVAGKKKSKFWVYAVEPVAGTPVEPPPTDYEMSDSTTQNQNGAYSEDASSTGPRGLAESEERSLRDGESGSPMDDF